MRPIHPHIDGTSGARVHDCWNSIGVRGDKSCPELAAHAHCRNCPAYSSAAALLLDQRLHDDGAVPEAGNAAAPVVLARKGNPVLLARLDNEWFALPMLALDQVIACRTIHSLPHRQNSPLLGLVNVRGELLVCVSLARLLGLATAAPGTDGARDAKMVVIRCGGGRVVFQVDEVYHHCRFNEADVRPLPATARMSVGCFANGLIDIEGRLAAIINEDRLGEAIESCLA